MRCLTHKKSFKLVCVIIVALAVTAIFIPITVRRYTVNYIFFPRADLNEIITDESLSSTIESSVKDYYQNAPYCSIKGERYQNGEYDYTIGWDGTNMEMTNDIFNISWDSGMVTYENVEHFESQSLPFEICIFQYNDCDWIPSEIEIQRNHANEFIFGYLRAVYVSPTEKQKTQIKLIGDHSFAVNTRDELYFLKEFCVFSVYSPTVDFSNTQIEYQCTKDKQKQIMFSVP